MKTYLTENDYIEHLNQCGIPEEDKKSNGGRIPDKTQYGTWLKRNDPIMFQVGYNEYISENRKVKRFSKDK